MLHTKKTACIKTFGDPSVRLSLSLCVCVCACACVHACVWVFMCAHECVHACVFVCCVSVCFCVLCVSVHLHVARMHSHIHSHASTHVHAWLSVRACMHACMHEHTFASACIRTTCRYFMQSCSELFAGCCYDIGDSELVDRCNSLAKRRKNSGERHETFVVGTPTNQENGWEGELKKRKKLACLNR